MKSKKIKFLFILFFIILISFFALLSVFFIVSIDQSDYITPIGIISDNEQYLSGKYAEYPGGENAYSFFPTPETLIEIGEYKSISFKAYIERERETDDSENRKNIFFLEIQYGKEQLIKILPEVLRSYSVLDREKYYSFYLATDKMDRLRRYYNTRKVYYCCTARNDYVIFEKKTADSGDSYVLCINDRDGVLRFIYLEKDDCDSKKLYHFVSDASKLWGDSRSVEYEEELLERFWNDNPPE